MTSEAARHHAAMAILAALGIAALVLGQPILVPFAVAIIVAFILAPLVRMLSSRGIPHPLSVVLVMGASLALAIGLAFLLSVQLLSLSTKVADYKDNFIAKIHSISALGREDGALTRAASALERLSSDISQEVTATAPSSSGTNAADKSAVVVRESKPQFADTAMRVLGGLEKLATA
ncbi:MAG: AI-2E family transporter, partial [Proteobacteria bacterium]|nr:AI-2E family transporter [Pseudomonadota bacterium]